MSRGNQTCSAHRASCPYCNELGYGPVPYHLAKYPGARDVSQVPALKAALTGVATTRFAVRATPDTRAVPNSAAHGGWIVKIAWVGVGGESHQLNLLETAVGKAMDGLGHESPATQYLPNVTVGRFDTNDRDWCHEMSDYWRNMLPLPTKAFTTVDRSRTVDSSERAWATAARYDLCHSRHDGGSTRTCCEIETSGPSKHR